MASKADKKYKQFIKIDNADPYGYTKIDTDKLGTQHSDFTDKYGDRVSGEYPYPGFALERKYQRLQTVEQGSKKSNKKYTKGSTSRKVNSVD